MEINENLVTEEVTENVEQTTEDTAEEVTQVTDETQPQPRMYSQEEVDDIVGNVKFRTAEKVKKKYEKKYGSLENVLRAGTGYESVEEMTEAFGEHYRGKGIDIPQEPVYSKREAEILAKAEAKEIIGAGIDEVIEEADRLHAIGFEKMTDRDKVLFMELTSHIQTTEEIRALARLGVGKDVYESEEFVNFRKMFAGSKTPIEKIYETYIAAKPKKEIRTAGSMKHAAADKGVKDYYTPEEIEMLSEDELKDPQIWATVRRSMTGS